MDRILLFIVLAAAVVSCGKNSSCSRVGTTLKGIESYIHERPDSALAVLESIDPAKLRTPKLRAKYSLWYTAALDKNYIDTTDLEVIRPAYEYYSKHGAPVDKMRACFYMGRIHANRTEHNDAIYFYMMALEDSVKVADNRYKDLVNSAIASAFSLNENYEQEVRYAQDALRYSIMAADTVGEWAICGFLATAYANAREWEKSRSTYEEFFSMPVYDTLTYYRKRILYAKELLVCDSPEPDRSLQLLNEVIANSPEVMTVEAYCLYARAQHELGNDAIADSVLEQLTSLGIDKEIVRFWRCQIRRDQGRYKQAYEDLEASVIYQDSVVMSVLRESLVQTQRDYLGARTTILKNKNLLERQRSAIIIGLLSLFVLLLAYLSSRRKSILNHRITELSLLYSESEKMLALQHAETASAQAKFASMFKAQFKALNELCAEYLSPIKKNKKERIYNEAIRQLEVIKDKESQLKFMKMVNDSLDNIIDKLRADLPGHKEQDFLFLTYVIAGFDATVISSLTGYSVGSVYTKKYNLKKIISELKSDNRNYYLTFIR